MPAEASPFVVAIIGAFVFFVVTVGGAALWTALPGRNARP